MKDSQLHLRFFVVGAMKAGTTSVFEYLRQHPRIYIPPGKEVSYFSSADLEHSYPGGWQQYVEETFGGAPSGAVCGTVTPYYMAGSLVSFSEARPDEIDGPPERIIPERIRATCPDARLIAVLRDPIERAYSHYQMQVVRGQEARPFASAVTDLLRPEVLERSRRLPGVANTYVTFGEYGRIMSAYYDIFPRDQILVVFTEDLERRPEVVTRRMFEHIGVDPSFVPKNLHVRYLQRAEKNRFDWLDLTRWQAAVAGNRLLRAIWRRAPRGLRGSLRTRYSALSRRAWVWNRIPSDQVDVGIGPETAAALRSHYGADLEHFESMIGQRVPWHPSQVSERDPGAGRIETTVNTGE